MPLKLAFYYTENDKMVIAGVYELEMWNKHSM